MLQKDVFMKDIWPTRNEIEEMEKQVLYPKLFTMVSHTQHAQDFQFCCVFIGLL